MSDAPTPPRQPPNVDRPQSELELEVLKERYSYKKFIWGSVVAAIAIAAIPPLFQLATAVLEYVRAQSQLKVDREEQYRLYVKEFLNQAVDQDIELRIRFADYFANVLDGDQKIYWVLYRNSLVSKRTEVREAINEGHRRLYDLLAEGPTVESLELSRELEWDYAEVGYAPRDQSVTPSPRTPEGPIPQNWIDENIVLVDVPLLASVEGFPPNGKIRLHRFAATPFAEAIAEIASLGLLDRVQLWGGSFANRTVRGTTRPTIHALGLAFDINHDKNLFGKPGPPEGADGSVAELVPIFEKHGFRWGGTFRMPDPMHFELVVAPEGETLPKPSDFMTTEVAEP